MMKKRKKNMMIDLVRRGDLVSQISLLMKQKWTMKLRMMKNGKMELKRLLIKSKVLKDQLLVKLKAKCVCK